MCILSPPATPILEDTNSSCSTSSNLSTKEGNSITVRTRIYFITRIRFSLLSISPWLVRLIWKKVRH